jgi:hypothetical protein
MSENVVYLHGQPKPIGRFLRIGSTGHRQLETLHESGKLHVDRVVINASPIRCWSKTPNVWIKWLPFWVT